jgi:hypothetical protein
MSALKLAPTPDPPPSRTRTRPHSWHGAHTHQPTTPLHHSLFTTPSHEQAERCIQLTDAKKRRYQEAFEGWAATNLAPRVVGNNTVVTTDPETGETSTSVVEVILTTAEQRSAAAAEYNELVSQAGPSPPRPPLPTSHTLFFLANIYFKTPPVCCRRRRRRRGRTHPTAAHGGASE